VISLDTNVIVRVVTADNPDQLAVALEIMKTEELLVCKTVLLETEWVLRYSYEFSRETILEIFRRFLGYGHLTVEDPEAVFLALDLFAQGLDFADALHLSSSRGAHRFATFDRPMANAARTLLAQPEIELLASRRP
jgi:predicted nucleic-acid-binding protein